MVKLGTLYPDGRVDDLGEVNGGLKPGADSARRAEEYGWDTHYEDEDAFYAGKQVEDTEELKYMFGIQITDLGQCGEQRTAFTSELIEDGMRKFYEKDDLVEVLIGLPDLKDRVEEWAGEEVNLDTDSGSEEVHDWCDHNIDEVDESLMETALLVVPVSVPGKTVREACGSEEHFETHSLLEFKKHGDWRSDVWNLAMYGVKVQVASKLSWVESSEFPTDDIEWVKQVSLQVKMMFGFFMDRQVNAIGETGWDWMRNFGIIFCGDDVVWNGHEGFYTVIEKEGDQHIVEDSNGVDFTTPTTELQALDFRGRLLRAKDAAAKEG